jgi:hypothetical protein
MGDERLQNPILLLKILMGTGKNFSENYWQLGRALSRRFPSPALHLYRLVQFCRPERKKIKNALMTYPSIVS